MSAVSVFQSLATGENSYHIWTGSTVYRFIYIYIYTLEPVHINRSPVMSDYIYIYMHIKKITDHTVHQQMQQPVEISRAKKIIFMCTFILIDEQHRHIIQII